MDRRCGRLPTAARQTMSVLLHRGLLAGGGKGRWSCSPMQKAHLQTHDCVFGCAVSVCVGLWQLDEQAACLTLASLVVTTRSSSLGCSSRRGTRRVCLGRSTATSGALHAGFASTGWTTSPSLRRRRTKASPPARVPQRTLHGGAESAGCRSFSVLEAGEEREGAAAACTPRFTQFLVHLSLCLCVLCMYVCVCLSLSRSLVPWP